MLKKIILATASLILLSTSIMVSPVKAAVTGPAASSWYNQTWPEFYGKVYSDATPPSEVFGERYTAAQVQWVYYSLVSMLFNWFAPPDKVIAAMNGDLTVLITDNSLVTPQQTPIASNNKNDEGFLAMLWNQDRPLSGITYIKDVGRKLNLVKEAHAQQPGFGYEALSVVRTLWQASRNVAYIFFIIAAIVLAFMVMFRFKVNPQTVVTVQSAIPKLVIAMILVTFSYAIAGLMVDLMYVVIGFIAIVYNSAFEKTTPLSSESSIYYFMTQGPKGLASQGGGLFAAMLLYAFLFFIGIMSSIYGMNGLAHDWGARFAVATLSPIISALTFIITIILVLILLWTILKTTWMMLKTFASILVKVIAGPVQIALGVVVPGIGFGSWLKGLIADLAVFPFISGALVLAFIFLLEAIDVAWGSPTWPAALGGGNTLGTMFFWLGDLDILQSSSARLNLGQYNYNFPPLIGSGQAMVPLIFVLVSLIILFSISKAADIIKGFLTGRPLGAGAAIGEAMLPIAGVYGAAAAGSKYANYGRISDLMTTKGGTGFWAGLGTRLGTNVVDSKRQKFIQNFFQGLQRSK